MIWGAESGPFNETRGGLLGAEWTQLKSLYRDYTKGLVRNQTVPRVSATLNRDP